MKTVLISGGLGALSKNIVKTSKEKIRWILVDIVTEDKSFTADPNITYVKADIRDGLKLEDVLKNMNNEMDLVIDGIVNTPA